jgi:anti-anti-sigma factor
VVDRLLPLQGQVQVHTEHQGDSLSVRPSGEIDLATVDRLREELVRAETHAPRLIVLDLSGLEFVDVTGIHAILDAERSAKRNGHEFRLVGGTGEVARVLDICGAAPNRMATGAAEWLSDEKGFESGSREGRRSS